MNSIGRKRGIGALIISALLLLFFASAVLFTTFTICVYYWSLFIGVKDPSFRFIAFSLFLMFGVAVGSIVCATGIRGLIIEIRNRKPNQSVQTTPLTRRL